MSEAITFDDINIVPAFSNVPTRAAVNLSVNMFGFPYVTLPVISANMDTVTDSKMAIAMAKNGAVGCLHRFCSIEENEEEFKKVLQDSGLQAMVSVGLGQKELERAEALKYAGAQTFVIDVNHGANIEVVKQAKMLREVLGLDYGIIVGNFATGKSIENFLEYSGKIIDGFKIGVGPGASCLTRIKTGVGIPQVTALQNCYAVLKKHGLTMIADGGMKTPGDIAKAIACGAHFVMIGSMLAGTDESPGETVWQGGEYDNAKGFKKYRGSASHESYIKQGKVAKHRAVEGESFLVPYKGPVENVLQDIEGGLRGSLSMVGAWNIEEFHKKAELIKVSASSIVEAGAHGKTK